MAANGSPNFIVPKEKQQALRRLMAVPFIPGPVALCLFIVMAGTISVDILALQGRLPLAWACVCNGVLSYFLFTVAHDSIHRSAARSQSLNDWIGRIGITLVFPHVTLGLFRWAHIQHHRFTNEPGRDPDLWLHGAWWQAPFRFAFIDVGYLLFIIRSRDPIARRHLRNAYLTIAFTVAAIAVLTWLGYGVEVLLLWFIPSRIAFILTGFMFFWLPHVKYDVSALEDVTQASSMRFGWEWLLTPAMQGQNYHLIHHLFPAMPSNRHEAAWRLLAPELRHRNLVIQHGFGIKPVSYNAQ
ncbi:fatty acid desaturase [Burkholderia vietnamiensis]|uniref:Fatty acid desaturase n=1 Tax=Burkholderia vietnamiensis TaxID=60552 RepID=A0AAW7SYV4_BURVI|nr:fatty acid desaturase [Burkholderia vietnamiensis]MBH9645861.1 fatty acid desaturase [Burkholderia vietnamiensis]MBR8008830.1 fatty acid desaturase [Burkholderia vietnamiensis]MDN7551311.1 fatty acid desaturase [Burkholderia vietnamiensis]MDN7795125.1 fatty acid desaturase [Burkholderia vietnamiensis]MDN8044967.1 fatty acid desaturase [Burkholderia vietnamiensis]